MRRALRIVPALLLLTLLVSPLAALPRPAPLPIDRPGEILGAVGTRWIGPFVSETTVRVGESGDTTIRWYSPDGSVVREAKGVVAGPGYVMTTEGSKRGYRAIHGDWWIPLDLGNGEEWTNETTPDSRTFVRFFSPEEGKVAARIRIDGKVVTTLGPYPRDPMGRLTLADDGSMAFPIGTGSVIVVAGPGGEGAFFVEVDRPNYGDIHPAPGGAGVVVQTDDGSTGTRTLGYHTREGLRSTRKLVSSDIIGWTPTGAKTLVRSYHPAVRYRLIDWEEGQEIWDVPDPGVSVLHSLPAVAIGERYVYIAGQREMGLGEPVGPVHAAVALDVDDGHLEAEWLPVPACHYGTDPGEFRRVDDRLYLLGEKDFCEVRAADVDGRESGWRSPWPAFAKPQSLDLYFKATMAFPDGYQVEDTFEEVVPHGWKTLDGGGRCIEGIAPDGYPFFIWLLPADWVGIQTSIDADVRESIRTGKGVKIIVQARDDALHEALRGVWPSTASLINGGAWTARKVFADAGAEVAAKVGELLRVYTGDEAAWEAAAHSLVLLGVPAEEALIRLVKRGSGEARIAAVGALGRLGCRAAVPAIIELTGEVEFTAEWAFNLWKHAYLPDEPEVALLRLTGDWGKAADGVRLMLLAPKEPGGRIALLLDNVGDADRDVIGLLSGRLIVNGESHEVGPKRWDGVSNLAANYVWVWPFPTTELLPEPGTYRIRYEVGEIESNEIEVVVE